MKIPVAEPLLGDKELEYISDAVKSGWISSKGVYIEKFENKFAEYIGVKYAVSCSNCTAALHLALVALNIGEGDEVILPTLTYIATANAVKYVGAKPVFVDSDKETWNIDVNKIEEKITERTKAIIPVHLYGFPCDMEKIKEIADKHNLKIIEDCAEAHGAEYKGVKIGSFGELACFSFYGNKIITTGEGGMIITNNEEIAEKVRILRNQGMSPERRYWHPVMGFNYRLTNMQAAIGLAQLEKIEEFVEKKIENAKYYDSLLKDVPGIELPPNKEDRKNVYWMYSILSEKKQEIIKALEEQEIETRPVFIPAHKMPVYDSNESFTVAEELSRKGINLPSSVKLAKQEIELICNIIKQVVS